VSRIYTVTNKKSGEIVRYVRANTLNAAIRALAFELYESSPTTAVDMFDASKAGPLNVLEAVAPEQLGLGGAKR